MVENDLIKNQIKVCLSCRKGQQFIRDYRIIHDIVIKKSISDKNMKVAKMLRNVLECKDEQQKKQILTQLEKQYIKDYTITSLINDVKHALKSKEYQDIYKKLSKYEFTDFEEEIINELSDILGIEGNAIEKYQVLKNFPYKAFEEETGTKCFGHLWRIVQAVRDLYEDDDMEIHKYPYEVTVLEAMNERNKELGSVYKDNMINLRVDWGSLQSNSIKDICKNIFETFCSDGFQNYEVENGRECECQLFLEIVKNIDESKVKTKNDFYKRINNLSETNQAIISDYLFNAPKKFGSNLQRIMLIQDMTESLISNLIGIRITSTGKEKAEVSKSTIQSLLECHMPSIEKKYIERICRILLVSEDVLKTGVGKRYGNWKDFFNEECIKEMKESDDFPNAHTDGQAKKNLKEEIQEIVKMDNAGFDEFLKKNEEYLYGEDCVLYETEWECFEALLNQDEFYTLLEVLERQS